MSNSSSFIHSALAGIALVVLLAAGCGSESPESPQQIEVSVPSEEPLADPMAIIPDDIALWEAFDAKRILKQPDTNTLVVEGVVAGNAEDLASELEALASEGGWTTDTLANNDGLSTLIMSKSERRLKVNLTQNGDETNVYLTTRLSE